MSVRIFKEEVYATIREIMEANGVFKTKKIAKFADKK
jgi:hypothetical protein